MCNFCLNYVYKKKVNGLAKTHGKGQFFAKLSNSDIIDWKLRMMIPVQFRKLNNFKTISQSICYFYLIF